MSSWGSNGQQGAKNIAGSDYRFELKLDSSYLFVCSDIPC